MQELTLNLPFNPAIFLYHQKLKWEIFFKKKYSRYLYFYGTISIILLIVLFNLLLGNGQPYSPAFFSVTLFLVVYNLVTPWAGIYKSRRKFFEAANKIASDPQKDKFNSTFIFGDEGLNYEDTERSYKLKWSLFNPFYLDKDTLVLTTRDHDTIFLLLGKAEVDDVLFGAVIDLLTKTVGRSKRS